MRYLRRIIRITAMDSPNVRERRDDALPGVLTYSEYKDRRRTWDKVRQTVGLDAMFYEGASILMYPPEWLDRAERVAADLELRFPNYEARRRAAGEPAMGVDPAEGGDDASWAVSDKLGLLESVSFKTPDTTAVLTTTYQMMEKWRVRPERVCFDRGGGGKEHADLLRSRGVMVRTVAFGEPLSPDPRPTAMNGSLTVKRHEREERYQYKNRRAQMYGLVRECIDPARETRGEMFDAADPNGVGKGISGLAGAAGARYARRVSDVPEDVTAFGIPARFAELRRQLAPIPLTYDPEGRLYLLPKHKRNNDPVKPSPEKTLTEIIGRSPDDADAFALSVYALFCSEKKAYAGPLR